MSSLPVSAPVVNSTTWFVPTVSVAYTFGEQDAREGLVCCPEMYFTHSDDKRDYAAGFASVAGETVTTRFFLGGNN